MHKNAAIKIVRILHHNGYQALFAGGCVRDMLMGRTPKDYDVATNARPDEIIKLFSRTIKVGAKFGVVIVLMNGFEVEVATFRSESGYSDGRRPDNVEFCDARLDAMRRDFTINGMFYDPVGRKIIDYVQGQKDIGRKLIRTIGEPDQRFGEDYLRLLRAVRFSTQLGFDIEKRTAEAIKKLAGLITKISYERIAMELEAVLTNPARAKGAQMLLDYGLLGEIFPALEANRTAQYGISVLGYLKKTVRFPLALSAILCGLDTAAAVKQAQLLKLSRNQIKCLDFLLKNKTSLLDTDMSLARLKTFLAEPYYRDLLELHRALLKSEAKSISPLVRLARRASAFKNVELRPKPLLNGHELIALGAAPGPQVGLLAEELYTEQLCENITTPGQAREWAVKWLKKHDENRI